MALKNPEEKGIEIAVHLMALAARTAPKARGRDNLVIKILSKDERERLAKRMEEIAQEYNPRVFTRDAKNIRQASAVILLGSRADVLGLDCGFCGFPCCEDLKKANASCSYVAGDLGIAIGSLVSKAGDLRVDNRIMYSAGYAALRLGLLGEDVKIAFGIPVSATGKNPFFDRK